MDQKFYGKNEDNVIDIDVEKWKNRGKKIIPTVLLVVVIILLVVNSIYTIDTKETGVIVRFGKVQTVVTKAGLHVKVPLVDQIRKVNVERVYNMEYGFRTLQEGTEVSDPIYEDRDEESNVIVDGANNNASIAIMELIIQYNIEDPVDYLFRVDDVKGTLRLALEDVVRSSVQAFTLDEAKTQKAAMDAVILPALQKKISKYNTGIRISKVSTQNVQFLPSVEEAYQQKENANQYKNGKVEDGQKYQNTIVPQAKAEAIAITENANAYAATVKAAAKADVAQFLAVYEEYKNNKEILRERYYLETMNEFMSNNKIVIDLANDGNIHKFYNFDENAIKESVTE